MATPPLNHSISREEKLEIRVHGGDALPTLIYLPGLHGDWTLVGAFRRKVSGKVRFVEIIYPRTVNWSIEDYSQEILLTLREIGIQKGWLLGESFGSQPAWAMVDSVPEENSFTISGLILAGGFVKYPREWPLRLVRKCCGSLNPLALKWFVRIMAAYVKLKHLGDAEINADLSEFIARRNESDRQAILHRLNLISAYDPRPVARRTEIPVFHLAGLIDPVVPWWLVRPWLRKNCPVLSESKILGWADHNVLGSAPRRATREVLRWMKVAD